MSAHRRKGNATAAAHAARASVRVFHAGLPRKAASVIPTKSAVRAPSGRKSAATHASATSSPARRIVLASTSSSAHSDARRDARAMAHANGTTSIPLAAHHAKPPKASTIAPAPTAAVRPASFAVSRDASHARPPSARNDIAHAAHTMASPRAPSAQKGARRAGHSMLVAPLVKGSPAWKRSGCPSAMARAYWKWMYASSSVAPGCPSFARTPATACSARSATASVSGP
ncbi:MAG: hypothetical protein ABSE49_15030 [Polyangiaceae bacterium]